MPASVVHRAAVAGALALASGVCAAVAGTSHASGGTAAAVAITVLPDPAAAPASVAPATAEPAASVEPTGVRRTLLEIVVLLAPAEDPVRHVLECLGRTPGPATTLPGGEAACADVAELGAGFFTARPDPARICTLQYGGPRTARITGAVDGREVDAAFSLTNGCEISRWHAARRILGPSGA